MEVIVKCSQCHKTQGTQFEKALTINVDSGSKCDNCGVEYNAYSLHCMKLDLPVKEVQAKKKKEKFKEPTRDSV